MVEAGQSRSLLYPYALYFAPPPDEGDFDPGSGAAGSEPLREFQGPVRPWDDGDLPSLGRVSHQQTASRRLSNPNQTIGPKNRGVDETHGNFRSG